VQIVSPRHVLLTSRSATLPRPVSVQDDFNLRALGAAGEVAA